VGKAANEELAAAAQNPRLPDRGKPPVAGFAPVDFGQGGQGISGAAGAGAV
jgi:hypothetical protein